MSNQKTSVIFMSPIKWSQKGDMYEKNEENCCINHDLCFYNAFYIVFHACQFSYLDIFARTNSKYLA